MPSGYRKDGTKLGFQKGAKNPKFGKKFTPEEKEEMSKLLKGKRTGSQCYQWKGGERINGGYIEIYMPNHPFCNKKKYVRKHRLVMEKHIGRYLLPEEIVHHKNGNILDNRIKNLKLFANNSKHSEHHYPFRVKNKYNQFAQSTKS